jgi:hypothetical protein
MREPDRDISALKISDQLSANKLAAHLSKLVFAQVQIGFDNRNR